jgi:hypothetical protein
MCKILKRLRSGESGQALILALLMLALGGFIITPLLTFMGSGLLAGESIEEKMNGIYAADAGIEDGIYKILNNLGPLTVGSSLQYTLPDELNKKEVTVDLLFYEDQVEFVQDLVGSTSGSEAHDEWQTAGDMDPANGIYTLTIELIEGSTPSIEKVKGVGAWFRGVYDDPPVLTGGSDITTDFPIGLSYEYVPYKGGTAFIWSWSSVPDAPWFQDTGDINDRIRHLEFSFTPVVEPSLYVGWVYARRADVGVITSGLDFGLFQITSTATDLATGSQTQIVAYLTREGEDEERAIDIISWEIVPGS